MKSGTQQTVDLGALTDTLIALGAAR